MDEQFPQLSHAQAIGREAEKVFESLLSSRLWVDSKIPQERDFGLDYRIEAVSDGKLKGCEFYVQLKGMENIDKRSTIPISVSTSTLRYWRNKLLPILIVVADCSERVAYFEWFDKSIKIEDDQKTQTIHVTTENQLLDYKLLLSMEPFYGNWTAQVQNDQKRAFYQWLLGGSVLITNTLVHTLGRLAYAPTMEKEVAKENREKLLGIFAVVLSKFMHDLHLTTVNVDLTQNPIDSHLKRLLLQATAVFQEIVYGVDEINGWGINLFNPSAAHQKLPTLSFIFTEINDFLTHHLLPGNVGTNNDAA